jgi:hypothetical protein
VITEGATKARQATTGMVIGSVAMAACCVVAVGAIPRLQALWGSLVAVGAWALFGFGLYWAVFIGGH